MKDSNSPQAPVQLSNTEGSGLLDVKQMAASLKSSSDAKKKNLIDMSLPMAPAAPLAGALLLPLPRQRSPLGLVGIIMGGTAAATAVILGTLFAAGVFEKKQPPAPLAVVSAPPPVLIAPPPVAETQPVAETPVVDPKKPGTKTSTKKTNTKATNTNTNTNNTTTTPPPPKKKTHKDELEELLGK